MNNKKLIEFRERQGYSQEQMAKILGYKNKASYCLIESGKTRMHIDLANKVSRVLELSDNEILEVFFNLKVLENQT